MAASQAGLSLAQQAEVLASGQVVYENRIGWALSFLANVGALERPSRGHYQITDAGRGIAAAVPGWLPGSGGSARMWPGHYVEVEIDEDVFA